MMEIQEFGEKLARLAKLAVRLGCNIQPGQDLILAAPFQSIELVRLIADEAYKAGAHNVVPFLSDDALTLARFEHGSDAALDSAPRWLHAAMAEALKAGAARLTVTGNTPGLLAGIPQDKISRSAKAQAEASRPALSVTAQMGTNWSCIPFASSGWAAKVFPDVPPDEAVVKLWELIFLATRTDQPDPVLAWTRNFDTLNARKARLQENAFDALHFYDGATDLTVGLAANHIWVGGQEHTPTGLRFSPNLPTEEVFTVPNRTQTQGRAVFSKPVVLGGTVVEDLVVTFEDGRAAIESASAGGAAFEAFLETDASARYLGEVALVPHSSPISQSGVLCFNTLFDENAACHIAFGNSYPINLPKGADAKAAGANESMVHMDCMIGTRRMNVDGVREGQPPAAIMRDGEFVF